MPGGHYHGPALVSLLKEHFSHHPKILPLELNPTSYVILSPSPSKQPACKYEMIKILSLWEFHGGPVVRALHSTAGATGSISGQGT